MIIFNSFTEAVVNSLTKGLTLADNTTSDIKTVKLVNVPTPTTDGGANGPTTVTWTKPSPPTAVLVGNVAQYSGTPSVSQTFTLASAVQVQWAMSSNGKLLKIIGVAGITPSQTTQYLLTLICIQG